MELWPLQVAQRLLLERFSLIWFSRNCKNSRDFTRCVYLRLQIWLKLAFRCIYFKVIQVSVLVTSNGDTGNGSSNEQMETSEERHQWALFPFVVPSTCAVLFCCSLSRVLGWKETSCWLIHLNWTCMNVQSTLAMPCCWALFELN